MRFFRVFLYLFYLQVSQFSLACSETDELRFAHWMDESTSASDSIGAINALAQDDRGLMWGGGENGLARFNGDHFSVFRHLADDPKSISNSYIASIAIGAKGALWAGTNSGLNLFDERSETFRRFDNRNGALPSDNILSLAYWQGRLWIGTLNGLWVLPDGANQAQEIAPLHGHIINALAAGSDGVLWVGADIGVGMWRPEQAQLSWFGNRTMDVRALALDDSGSLWVGTYNEGLLRASLTNGQWREYGSEAGIQGQTIRALEFNHRGELWVASELGGVSRYSAAIDGFYTSTWHVDRPASLASNKAKALKTDALGDLWVGLFPNGIDHASRFANQFCNYQATKDDSGLSNRSVISLLPSPTSAGDLWIGSEYGLNYFSAATGRFTHYLPQKGVDGQLQTGPILALAPGDTPESVWVSAWGSGLYQFNLKTHHFNWIPAKPNLPGTLQTPDIWALLRAKDGTLYLGGSGGGLQIHRGDGLFEHFLPDLNEPDSISSNFIRCLAQTKDGRIFVGTTTGLDEFLPEQKRFTHWLRDEHNISVVGAVVVSLYESVDGFLWIGTQGAGVIRLNLTTKEKTVFTHADGLPSDFVATINQDKDGNIWVGTLGGLAKLQGGRFDAIEKSLGTTGNSYNRNASALLASGELWFGGVQGLTHFNPRGIMNEAASPGEVHFSALRLFNKPQAIGSKLLPVALDFLPEIELDSTDSMITIDFYALNYRAPIHNRFAYKLVGVDKDFIDTANVHSATYTHLPAGTFTLQVKAADSLGQWHPAVKELRIVMNPAWWATYWAYTVYGVLAGMVVLALWRFRQKRWELNKAQALNESLRQLSQLKDTFLANTSHELRTPLNGIIGLTEALYDGSEGPLNEGVLKTLKIISSSGRRLSYLINDILDFSKLSKKELQLCTRPMALKPIVDGVLGLVGPLVGDKPLVLTNNVPEDLPSILADHNRLQQILLNLIGNAVKFTKEGSVVVSAELIDNRVQLHVSDTGIGIEQKDFAAIFLEFSQVDSSEVRAQGGTGLGLAIAKHLVQLHGGQLQVTSKVGQGSDFYFSLPVTADAIVQEEDNFEPAPAPSTVAIVNNPTSANTERSNTILCPKDIVGQFTVLVVDDDPVNRMVLSSILKLHQHRIIEANSGEQALEILSGENSIDMAILDVMMPTMSGFETAMRIRVKYPVHLLPIIFLTAKNYSDDLVRGFVAGGNDFLTKPVSKQELLTRVTSHLRLLQINRCLEENLKTRVFEHTSTQAELQALDKIIASLNSEMNPAILLKTLLNQILLLVHDADGASVWQLNDSKSWICSAALALGHKYLGEQCFIVDEALVEYLTSLGQSHKPIHALSDFKNTPMAPLYDFFEHPDNTLIAVAAIGNNLVGIIALSYSGGPPNIDEYLVNAINRIKSHAASVLLKAKLMQLD